MSGMSFSNLPVIERYGTDFKRPGKNTCFPSFLKFTLFVRLFVKLFSFLPCFLSLVKRTIILVISFQIFKASPQYRGKKLVEFDLDLLESTQISSFPSFCLSLWQILSFPFPVFKRHGTQAKISNLSSLIWFPNTLFFIQAFQNATFGVKNTALAQKSVKLQQFDDISIIVVQINLHQT